MNMSKEYLQYALDLCKLRDYLIKDLRHRKENKAMNEPITEIETDIKNKIDEISKDIYHRIGIISDYDYYEKENIEC